MKAGRPSRHRKLCTSDPVSLADTAPRLPVTRVVLRCVVVTVVPSGRTWTVVPPTGTLAATEPPCAEALPAVDWRTTIQRERGATSSAFKVSLILASAWGVARMTSRVSIAATLPSRPASGCSAATRSAAGRFRTLSTSTMVPSAASGVAASSTRAPSMRRPRPQRCDRTWSRAPPTLHEEDAPDEQRAADDGRRDHRLAEQCHGGREGHQGLEIEESRDPRGRHALEGAVPEEVSGSGAEQAEEQHRQPAARAQPPEVAVDARSKEQWQQHERDRKSTRLNSSHLGI